MDWVVRQARDKADKLVRKGQLARALEVLEALGEERPDDAPLAEHIAAVHEQLAEQGANKHPELAAESLQRAATLWASVGRHGRAVKAARQLAALAPEHQEFTARVKRRRLIAAGRDAGLALLSPLLLLAANPPWDLWPLALVGLLPLYLAIRRRPPGAAFVLGWLAGIVANVGGICWGVDLLERFAGMDRGTGWLTIGLVSAYQGTVFALWAGGTRWLGRRFGVSSLWAAPLLIVLLEALLPFVFPWYLAICVWRAWPLLQVAELGGPPAVSALVVLCNLVLLALVTAALRRQRPGRPALVALAVLVGVVGLGLVRAGQVAGQRGAAPAIKVGIVQPNFGILSTETRKRKGQHYVEVLRKATERAGREGAELVLWPESMFPFLFDRQLEREYVKGHPWNLRGSYQGRLLIGLLSHPFGEAHIFNSAALFSADGARRGLYDKNKLLVFGEYIPFRDRYPAWAKRMREKLPDWPDIAPGRETKVLVDGELRVLPLICYEDLLSGYVLAATRAGSPNLLVTLVNHAWFGVGAAPRQSLALSTFRAIETRRDLARAANTGVSSVVDALGRVLVEGPLHDVPRDKPLPPEVFVEQVHLLESFALGPRTAPLFPLACGLALSLVIAAAWRRGKQ
jgi:apolipoprotein N-acyltransferase